MKKTIRICALALSIFIIIGMYGCNFDETKKDYTKISNTNENSTAQEIVVAMKKHLYKKYGYIDYKIEGFLASGWSQSCDQLNLSTTIDGIEESFCVKRYNDDGMYTFKDNYFGLVVREEFEELVGEYAEKYFPEFKVFAGMTENMYPNSLTANSSLQDLLTVKDQLRSITFIVLVNEKFRTVEEFNEIAKTFIADWANLELVSMPRVVYLSNSNYETAERANCLDFLGDNNIAEYREMIKQAT